MTQGRRRILAVGVSCLLPLAEGLGAPVPSLDIPDLVAKSDVVAVGTVSVAGDAGPTSIETPNRTVAARLIAGTIEVDQVLKGPEGLITLQFQYAQPDEPIGFGSVTAGNYRVFFLKRRGDSTDGYIFTSPHHLSVVAIQGSRVRAASTTEMMLEAVEQVVTSPKASPALRREAIHVLSTAKGSAPRAGLRSALQDPDRVIRLSAAAALLQADDLEGLAVAEVSLLRPELGVDHVLLNNLRAGIALGIKGPAAVPALTRLSASPDAETRRAATRALSRTQSTVATAPLVRALDDGDFEVRLNGARGLAELTGQEEWIPSWDAFRADEARFVAHWKEWAARQ